MRDEALILDRLRDSYDEENSLSDYFDFEELDCLCDSDLIDIRIWLAKALSYHQPDIQAIVLLRKLYQDTASCVRVEAIDSLSAFETQDSFEILCSAASDPDELVRAYSAFGIALVGRRISPVIAHQILLRMAETESSIRTLVNIFEGLYILGQKEMLDRIIGLFDSSDYRIQCAVLHALEELLCTENKSAIKQFVDGLNLSTYTCAVADTIERLASECLGA